MAKGAAGIDLLRADALILAFSTSSPIASVAAVRGGEVLWSDSREARMRASQACLEMLPPEIDLATFDAFAADLGPGSFTGVRVGIVLAKTFAYLHAKPCVGADAFDLIDPERAVAFPSKRGEFFIRQAGGAIERAAHVPAGAVGFGFGDTDRYPSAAGFAKLADLRAVAAEAFLPEYLIEPSISMPKKPFAEGRL